MSRTTKSDKPSTSERTDIAMGVKMPPEMAQFLETAGPLVGVKTGASVIRALVEALRTFFHVPPTMADVLRRDMQARNLTVIPYVQELLLKRYHEILDAPERRK